MIDALIRGVGQLADRATRSLLVRCVLLAVLTLALLVVLAPLVFGLLGLTGLGWLDGTLAVAGSALGLVLAWLLFPVTVTATLAWYADELVDVVERQHYPGLPPAGRMAAAAGVWAGVRFAAVAIGLNLIALPVYLLLPGLNYPLYLALNGHLLGREYFELVAGRRFAPAEVSALRHRRRLRVWLAGVVIAALLNLPLVNLVAPVVAIAFMVHLFHRWQGPARGAGDHGGAWSSHLPGDGSV